MRHYGWLGTALFCLGLGCSYEEAEGPAPEDALPADLTVTTDAAPRWPRTYLLTLDAGAFPKTAEHPSALLYVPTGFVASPPVSMVVYIHGFNNCVENIVRPTASGQPCKTGGAVRNAYNLIAQLEASGRNALLLCPEVAFDRASSDPGQLGVTGGFRALVKEALLQVQADLGSIDVDKLGPVVVASHSGGYAAAAPREARRRRPFIRRLPGSATALFHLLGSHRPAGEDFLHRQLPGIIGWRLQPARADH